MDISQLTSVTKVYNWKGEVKGYLAVDPITNTNIHIPLAEGNRHYQIVTEMVREGKCILSEPLFSFFYTIKGRSDAVVGYDTNLGFVPADNNNDLYLLLLDAISKGAVNDRGLAGKWDIPRCTHLKFCLFFPRPWPHLAGPLTCNWGYRTSLGASRVTCGIRMSNHPENSINPMEAAMSSLGLDDLDPPPSVSSLQQAMLEIKFSLKDLWRLFRSERNAGFGPNSEFIEDQIEQGRIRFDCKRGCPDMRILLQVAPQFLRRAVADIANDVAQTFNREYGGASVGFIREPNFQEQFLCLLCYEEGDHHLWQFGQQHPHSFNLAGEWPVRAPDPQSKALPLDAATNRLGGLIASGFVFEAIVVANAYFEVVCREMVAAIVSSDQEAKEWVLTSTKFTYNRSRALLSDLIGSMKDDHSKSPLITWLDNLATIYEHRNAYAHALKLINHELDKSVDTVREAEKLLRPILDVHEQHLLLGRINQILIGSTELIGHDAKAKAISAIKDSMGITGVKK